MIRGGLFTRYWLEDGIRQTPQYRALSAEQVAAAAEGIARLWRAFELMAAPSEAETESEFIHPVLDQLGWQRLPQQEPGEADAISLTSFCS